MAVTTKRQILTEAFEEIGLAGYIFNLAPADVMSALRKLDALVASWEASGLTYGWPFSSNPNDSDPDDEITVPDAAIQPLVCNLALRIAPSFGKQASIETRSAALSGLNILRTQRAFIPKQQFADNVPIGSGNYRGSTLQPYFTPENPINANGNELEL